MIRIIMEKTLLGSPNGLDVYEYREGEVYDLPDEADGLAQNFLGQGAARLYFNEPMTEQLVEAQALSPPIEESALVTPDPVLPSPTRRRR